MNSGIRKILKVILVLTVSLSSLHFTNTVYGTDGGGWIGTSDKTPSGGSSAGNPGGNCDNNANRYREDCAGSSWAFYKVIPDKVDTVNSSGNVSFPNYLSSGISVTIPNACAAHKDGGFWHFGVNLFGTNLDFTYGGWYGHWKTITPQYYSWDRYNVPNSFSPYPPSGKSMQIVENLYKFDRYDTAAGTGEALEAYREAYLAQNPNANPPNSIPSNTWGFCWWPGMSAITVRFREVDATGWSGDNSSISSLPVLKEEKKEIKSGESVAYTPTRHDNFNIFGRYNSSSYWPQDNYAEYKWDNVTSDRDVYFLYKRNFTVTLKEVDATNWPEPSVCTGAASGDLTSSQKSELEKLTLLKNPPLQQTTNWGGEVHLSATKRNDYELYGWYNGHSCWESNRYEYDWNGVSEDRTVYALYRKKTFTFEGRAQGEFGDIGVDTGWKTEDTTRSITVECKKDGGCEATFTLSLNGPSESPEAKTWYAIKTGAASDEASQTLVAGENAQSSGFVKTFKRTMKPTETKSETICYSLIFHVNGKTDNSDRRIETACITAIKVPPTITVTPECPGKGFLDVFVKNVTTGGDWTKEAYAKPTDNLSYCSYYDPSTTQSSSGYNFDDYDCAESCSNKNHPIGRALGLSNSIAIRRVRSDVGSDPVPGGSILAIKNYAGGNTNVQITMNPYNNVPVSDVGRTINQRINTNGNTPTSTAYTTQTPYGRSYSVCPSSSEDCYPHDCNCETCCDEDEDGKKKNCHKCNCDTCYYTCYYHYVVGHISTATKYSEIAKARIPYNFINTTAITSPVDNNIVYAGEAQSISFDITTGPKYNAVTKGTYTTRVDNAKWKLRVEFNGSSYYTNEYNDLNSTGKGKSLHVNDSTSNSSTYHASTRQIIIPDLPIGSKVCVSSMVYPASSGADTNWNDSGGSHTWAESPKKCYVIAKRPSIQILGGNVYTDNTITTGTSSKYHVSGVTSYNADYANYTKSYNFGSWTDQGVIANGTVSGFASGASLGYSLGSLEGSSPSYCNRIPLSFANSPCGGTSGGLSKTSNNSADDKNNIFKKYVTGKTLTNKQTISATTISDTQVYYAKEINITGNISYVAGIKNFSTMPRAIIYATESINIGCNVSRIDGILIAKKVVTCAGKTETGSTKGGRNNVINVYGGNAEQNNIPLKINGAVITNQLVANRTYGAGIGTDSITPAEIINFDPSLYYITDDSGDKNSSTGENTNIELITTYQKELAPRY